MVSRGASGVVTDDVLSAGKTLCAALRLSDNVGIRIEDIVVMVAAEFPIHRVRELLLRRA